MVGGEVRVKRHRQQALLVVAAGRHVDVNERRRCDGAVLHGVDVAVAVTDDVDVGLAGHADHLPGAGTERSDRRPSPQCGSHRCGSRVARSGGGLTTPRAARASDAAACSTRAARSASASLAGAAARSCSRTAARAAGSAFAARSGGSGRSRGTRGRSARAAATSRAAGVGRGAGRRAAGGAARWSRCRRCLPSSRWSWTRRTRSRRCPSSYSKSRVPWSVRCRCFPRTSTAEPAGRGEPPTKRRAARFAKSRVRKHGTGSP